MSPPLRMRSRRKRTNRYCENITIFINWNSGAYALLLHNTTTNGIKRGEVVKNIRLTDNTEEIEGKVDKVTLVLKIPNLKIPNSPFSRIIIIASASKIFY